MPANRQDIVQRQQLQIAKLLKRLNELNSDHQELLELHNNEQQRTSSVSNRFGIFGKKMKDRIATFTTPRQKSFNFKTVQQSCNSTDSTEPSVEIVESDDAHHVIGVKSVNKHNKCVQTLTMNRVATMKNVSQQTDVISVSEQQLVEQHHKLTRQYTDVKELYDDILRKHSRSSDKMEIREGQLKDMAQQRNKLRRKLQEAKTENSSLLQVLEMKSKISLDPDVRSSATARSLNHAMDTKSLESDVDDTNSLNSSISKTTSEFSRGNMKHQSQAKALMSPLSLPMLFKPVHYTEQVVAKDSVSLANKLMKVIQDKDTIITGLRAQLKHKKNAYDDTKLNVSNIF
eukprot:47175_1